MFSAHKFVVQLVLLLVQRPLSRLLLIVAIAAIVYAEILFVEALTDL